VKRHTPRYFAEDAFKAVGSKQKELVIVRAQTMSISTTMLPGRSRSASLSSSSKPA
jgi:hypothetical protein